MPLNKDKPKKSTSNNAQQAGAVEYVVCLTAEE